MQNPKPTVRVLEARAPHGHQTNATENRPILTSRTPVSAVTGPISLATAPIQDTINAELPPHLLRTQSSPASTVNPVRPPPSGGKRPRATGAPQRKSLRIEESKKAPLKSTETEAVSKIQTNESVVIKRRTTPVSDSPMDLIEDRNAKDAALSSACYIILAKLRVFLAEKMHDALKHDASGGFGIRFDHVEKEFRNQIEPSRISALLTACSSAGFQDLVSSRCADLVELKQLVVGSVGMMGCAPAAEFCKAPKKIEDEMKAKLEHAQSQTKSSVQQGVNQDSLTSTALISMTKELLKSTVQEILSLQKSFPTVDDFAERFSVKYGKPLDPKIAGFDTLMELLKGLQMEDTFGLISKDGMVYLVPSSQIYLEHQQNKQTGEDLTKANNTTPQTEAQEQEKETKTTTAAAAAVTEGVQKTSPEDKAGPVRSPETDQGVEVKLQTVEECTQVVDLAAEEEDLETMFKPMNLAELDNELETEILNRLRHLLTNALSTGNRCIPLNRLPMYFFKCTNRILDYKKYGFISLADVVALLEDIVQVVETSKGKMITALPQQRKRVSQSTPMEQTVRHEDAGRTRTGALPHQLVPRAQLMDTGLQSAGLLQPSPVGLARREVETVPHGYLQTAGWRPGGGALLESPVTYQQFPGQHSAGVLSLPQQETAMSRQPNHQMIQHLFNGFNRSQTRPY